MNFINQRSDRSRAIFISALLAVITLLAYWQVFDHDFTNYDDPDYVTANSEVQRGLTWENVGWAFSHTVSGNWHPLTILSHMMDCQLFGLRPGWHHFTNLLLHLANTLLLFHLLRRMTDAFWRCATVAALFALHPLHVESVAWIAERKDVLSTFFALLTLLSYVKFAKESKTQNSKSKLFYLSALVTFITGLMSKPMLVTLPFLMLLLDYWPLGRFSGTGSEPPETSPARRLWPLIREKLPFFILSAIMCVITVWVQKNADAVASLSSVPLDARAENAVVAYAKYLGKIFWPSNLAVFYPYPEQLSLSVFIFALALMIGVCVLCFRFRKTFPFLVTGWLWFLGTLIPVIGLVQVGGQSMADRYTYIPSIGIFIMLIWGVNEIYQRGILPRLATVTAVVIALVFCATRTWTQLSHWQNSETLFRHALAVTQNNHIAHYNLGEYLFKQGNLDEAVFHYRAALQIKPDDKILSNLGIALAAEGKFDEAIGAFEEALKLKPDDIGTLNNFGVVLFRQRKFDEAIIRYRTALKIKSDDVETLSNLAGSLVAIRKYDEAIACCEAALRVKPDVVAVRLNLINVLTKAGRTDEVIAQYDEVLRLSPKLAPAHKNLADLLLSRGQNAQARTHYLAAIKADPMLAEAHYQLGMLLFRAGEKREAIARLSEAVRLKPDSIESLNALAWILATDNDSKVRNGASALQLAQFAAEMTKSKNPSVLDTLAAACAENDHFTEAIETAQQAIDLSSSSGNQSLAKQIHAHLELYRNHQPVRE